MATKGTAGTKRATARRVVVGCVTGLLAATATVVAVAPASALEEPEEDRCAQYFVAHADLNYDGIGDILTVEPTRHRLRWLQGLWYGSFGGGDIAGRGFGSATAIGLGNVNDFYGSEVFWTDTAGVMRIESYQGAWGPEQHTGTVVVGRGWNAVREWTVGDVTADGYDDIVGLRGSELWLWEGRHNGRFQPGRLVGAGWAQADRLMVEPLQLTRQAPDCTPGPAVDGHLLATFRDGRMASYQVRGGGKFAPAQPVGHGWASFQHVMLSDVDLHRGPAGRLDLLGQDGAGSWWSYEGLAPRADGTPRFGPARPIDGPPYGARLVAP